MDFGYYDNVKDLIDAINKALLAALGNDSIHLAFNPRTAKVKVYIKKKHGLAFFDKLSRMLGFGGEDTKLLKTIESPFVAVSFSRKSSETQTSIYFEPFLLAESRVTLASSAGIAFKFAGESCRRCLPKPEDFGPAM